MKQFGCLHNEGAVCACRCSGTTYRVERPFILKVCPSSKPTDPQSACRDVRRRRWIHAGSGGFSPLTARFENFPTSHNGSTAFTFEFHFGAEIDGLSYAADWTAEQLREPAQRIADRIDESMNC